MATRFIKDTIWTSPNLNQLSDMAERHFYRLLPLPDDHGCCEVTPAVVKGRCYPLKGKVTVENIQKWTQELAEADIIRVWEDKGRLFAWFPTWAEHQRVRSLNKRKTPEPPTSVVNCRQVSLNVASYSPVPCPSSPVPSLSCSSGDERFEKFWEAYPKKKSKGQAEKMWKSIQPNEQLFQEILLAVGRARKSVEWTENKKFIPHPATWLNAKGWKDEHPRTITDPRTGIEKLNPVYRDDPDSVNDPPDREQIRRELRS